MASFDVFDSFLIIKTSQEWGRTWYSPWQSKIEAKLHEESKFWRALKPLPNQSSMQGRKSEKESNIEEFRNPLRNFCKLERISQGLRNWGKFRNSFSALRNFCKPEGISQALQNWWISQPHTKFSQPCEIFLKSSDIFAPIPLDFYLKIFCVIIYSFLVIS